jgi:hypothetical protein
MYPPISSGGWNRIGVRAKVAVALVLLVFLAFGLLAASFYPEGSSSVPQEVGKSVESDDPGQSITDGLLGKVSLLLSPIAHHPHPLLIYSTPFIIVAAIIVAIVVLVKIYSTQTSQNGLEIPPDDRNLENKDNQTSSIFNNPVAWIVGFVILIFLIIFAKFGCGLCLPREEQSMEEIKMSIGALYEEIKTLMSEPTYPTLVPESQSSSNLTILFPNSEKSFRHWEVPFVPDRKLAYYYARFLSNYASFEEDITEKGPYLLYATDLPSLLNLQIQHLRPNSRVSLNASLFLISINAEELGKIEKLEKLIELEKAGKLDESEKLRKSILLNKLAQIQSYLTDMKDAIKNPKSPPKVERSDYPIEEDDLSTRLMGSLG